MAAVAAIGRSPGLEMTLALIKPSICSYQPDVSAILKHMKRERPDLYVVRQKRIFWKTTEAEEFYAEHQGKFYYDRLIAGMTSGPSMAMALAGPNAIASWRSLLGPTKAYRAKWEHPNCFRAIYGLGDTRNGFHGSELSQVFEGFAVEAWLADEQMSLVER